MKKLIYILLLLPISVFAQVPAVNDSIPLSNSGAAYTASTRVMYYQGHSLLQTRIGTSALWKTIASTQYLRDYYVPYIGATKDVNIRPYVMLNRYTFSYFFRATPETGFPTAGMVFDNGAGSDRLSFVYVRALDEVRLTKPDSRPNLFIDTPLIRANAKTRQVSFPNKPLYVTTPLLTGNDSSAVPLVLLKAYSVSRDSIIRTTTDQTKQGKLTLPDGLAIPLPASGGTGIVVSRTANNTQTQVLNDRIAVVNGSNYTTLFNNSLNFNVGAFGTTLQVTPPSASRTITLKDGSGNIPLETTINTWTGGSVYSTGFNTAISIVNSLSSTAGSAPTNYIDIAPTLNLTGTYNGIQRGFYYHPTGANSGTSRAIETTSGDVILGGTPAYSTGGNSTLVLNTTTNRVETVPALSNVFEISGTTQQASINSIYIPHSTSLTTITLPATAPIGALVQIIGEGTGRWRLNHGNASDIIVGVGGFTTVAGATHGYETNDANGTITVRKSNTNKWNITSTQGTGAAY